MKTSYQLFSNTNIDDNKYIALIISRHERQKPGRTHKLFYKNFKKYLKSINTSLEKPEYILRITFMKFGTP